MIENDYFNKLMKIPAICGWTSSTLEIEECEEADNQIYVSSDIHKTKIDEMMIYSSLHSIIIDCEDLLGDLLKDSEVIENDEENVSPYRLILRVSTNTSETRTEEP